MCANSASGHGETSGRDGVAPMHANDPRPLLPIYGRERELAQARLFLEGTGPRLLTFTGPGGVGKTRLAIRLMADISHLYPDGAFALQLAAVRDPNLLIPMIAYEFGIRDSGEIAVYDRLVSVLSRHRVLLVLDNFEQIILAADQIGQLLSATSQLHILVTSRVPLSVFGEQEMAIQPLSLPDHRAMSVDELAENPAVALFVHRASSVRAEFELTAENAETVASVCQRLDGLPLAIELAAVRMKVLSPTALLGRLSNSLDLLTGGPRNSPDRQRTMRSAITWSYELLSAVEQELFANLSIFAGGFTLEAASAVAGATLDSLSALVDSSLVRAESSFDGEPRFQILELNKEFGREKVVEAGQFDDLAKRHGAYFLNQAEYADQFLFGGSKQTMYLNLVEQDHDNIRATLYRMEETGDYESILRMSAALAVFWYLRGHLHEGQAWLQKGLDRAISAPPILRARALQGYGLIATYLGDLSGAAKVLEESLEITLAEPGKPGLAMSLGLLGVAIEDSGDFARGSQLFDEAIAAVDTSSSIGQSDSLLVSLRSHRGVCAWGMGEIEKARSLWEQSLAAARGNEDWWWVANCLGYLALAAVERKSVQEAASRQHESLSILWQMNAVDDLAGAIAGAACVASAQGDNYAAIKFFRVSETLRIRIGSRVPPPERDVFRLFFERSRAALPDEQGAAAEREGSLLTTERAVAEALDLLRAPIDSRSSGLPTSAMMLTPRERDVLRLLVAGQTDREIAESLFISPRTAQGHVARLFDKLDVSTRTAAVALALQQDLLHY